MKQSRFNMIIPYENWFLGYNSFSNKYMIMDPLLKDLFKASIDENSVDELKNIHLDFYSELLKNGFIVEDHLDEIEKVKELRSRIDLNEEEFHLIINPTMNCNFKCWYCYESHIKDSKMDEDTIEKIKKLIQNKLNDKRIKSFRLSWFGGEPLLFFDQVIKPLLIFSKKLSDEHNIKFSSDFTTNGFLIREEMVKFLKDHKAIDFQITLDGNKENHNKVRFVNKERGSYDEIIENIKILASNWCRVKLRINYTKDNISGIKDILNDLKYLKLEFKQNIIFSLNSVWQEGFYDRKTVNNYIQDIVKAGFNAHTNWVGNYVINSCYADRKNQATINFNGEIFKCTARDFVSNNKEGDLQKNGIIDWNEKFDKRMNIKFKNKPCLECVIMPICNGGCSQSAMENEGKDYCTFEKMGITKEEIVMDKFLQSTLEIV